MLKLRFKLATVISLIIFLVMAILGLAIGEIYEEFTLTNLKERLKKEATLAAHMVAKEGFDEQLVSEMSALLDARITVITSDGTVVIETETDPSLMENHIDRPEIKAIEENKEASYIRVSETLNEEILYYAVSINTENDQTIGYLRVGVPTTLLDEFNNKIWTILAVCFGIAFLVIVYVTYRVTNQMIKPIESATVVANELAEGNYGSRTAEGAKDEVGQLTRSINILAHNLERLTNRHQAQKENMETLIENMGSGLILINTRGDISLINGACRHIFEENTDLWLNQLYHDVIKQKEMIKFVQSVFISEQKQRKQIQFPVHFEVRHFEVYGAPVMSKKGRLKGIAIVLHDITELKKLEQIRKDFVANVSHELKTPVTSIKGFTETLLDGAMESEELREKFLQIIAKESERLQGLIYDLLELSKIEQQYFELNWQKTNLQTVLEEVIVVLREKANEKGIKLEFAHEGNGVIEGDPERLKQIAINLINNGITYTPENGLIQIVLHGSSDEVEMRVIDTGIGISENELPRIFERFYRVDRARSRNSGGTGLGLAIVKHLVEAHNAKISVQSEVGKGTTFSIRFKRNQLEVLDVRKKND